MRDKILDDLKTAMKNKDKEKLSVIRMVKGAIQLEELDKKKQLSDDEVINIISKEIKTRKESLAEFEKGNREDLISKTESEIKILEQYLPKQLSNEEALEIIEKTINEIKPESMKDMGKIMQELKKQLIGKYDMSEASRIVKEKIKDYL